MAKMKSSHTNRSELAPDVQDHDDSHNQGHDMHKRSSALKDYRVGQLDVARIAVRFNSVRPLNVRYSAYDRA